MAIFIRGHHMADYKAMYYHLSGRMATTIEVLEYATDTLVGTTEALTVLIRETQKSATSHGGYVY